MLDLVRQLPILVVVALVVVASPARGERVAVGEIRLLTEAAKAVQVQADERLRQVLRREGFEVVQLHPEQRAEACTMGPCLARVGERLRVDRVIAGNVAAHGSSYDLILTMMETAGGTVVAQVSKRCDVCTYAEVAELVEEGAEALVDRARRYVGAHGLLIVRSDPTEADVLLDGVPVGVTPLRRLVPAGYRALQLKKDQLRVLRRVHVRARQTHMVWPRLRRVADASSRGKGRTGNWARWTGWTLLGLGMATGALGATLWGVEGGCNPGCGGRNAGIVLVGLGVATGTVGGLLLWRDGDGGTSVALGAGGRRAAGVVVRGTMP